MRVNRAKRRLIRWQRYTVNTGSRPANIRLCGNHRGIVNAFSDVMYAKRCPHPGKHYGARGPYMPLWASGWKVGS